MSPWTILGWILVVLVALQVLGSVMIALGNWLERQTPEGRAAQACRNMADYFRRRGR